MRKTLFTLAVIASALSIPLTAHADTIDDFVLVGQGHTITYSLPNSAIIMDHPHGVILQASAPTTIDGVSGYNDSGQYYLPFPGLPSVILGVPSSIAPSFSLVLYGISPLQISQVIPISDPSFSHPDDLLVAFAPGTYSLQTRSFISPSVDYTLTITPETATTPEPST
jgi:hypothetical protein